MNTHPLFRFAPVAVCVCAALTLVGALRAQETKAPPAKGPATTNLSVFNAPPVETPGGRNPFLPIGYIRPVAAPAAAPVEVVPTVGPEQFVVTSFSLEPPPLAVINGRTYSVGERIPVDASGREFVIVRRIVDGGVVLEHRGRTFRCESRRAGGGGAARK